MISRIKQGRLKASMTLEATLIIPLFLFAILNMYSAVTYIQVHTRMCCAMCETGLMLARQRYAYEQITEGHTLMQSEPVDSLFALTYVKNDVLERVGEEYLESIGIEDGPGGISFLMSDVTSSEYIDLQADYKVMPRYPLSGFNSFRMRNNCRLRAWNGYDNVNSPDNSETEQMVYITKTGSVYHLSSECSYLKLSVSEIRRDELPFWKNADGEEYTPCEKCGNLSEDGNLYIAENGKRYHTDRNCSGLKRTVYTVPISSVGERSPCSRCGAL